MSVWQLQQFLTGTPWSAFSGLSFYYYYYYLLWTYFSHFCLVVFLSSWYPRIFKIVWFLVKWKTHSFSFLLFVNIIQPFEKVTCKRLPSKEQGYFLSSNDYSYVIFNHCSSSWLIFSVSAYCYLPLIACYHE